MHVILQNNNEVKDDSAFSTVNLAMVVPRWEKKSEIDDNVLHYLEEIGMHFYNNLLKF